MAKKAKRKAAPKKSGGQGDHPSAITRAEMVLLRQAARQDWGVPGLVRNEAVFRLYVILSKGVKPSYLISAAKTLAAFDRCDLENLRISLDRDRDSNADETVRDAISDAEVRADAHVPEQPPPGAA